MYEDLQKKPPPNFCQAILWALSTQSEPQPHENTIKKSSSRSGGPVPDLGFFG